jgi:DOPA 4,5-dioxygenase
MATASDITTIRDWHAHIYFTPATRAAAAELRDWVAERFPAAVLGRWHEDKVGPHPEPMYQIAFPIDLFPTLVPFLALNRQGLTVLVHPQTRRERDDHLRHAMWLGAVLPLDASRLREEAP